MKAFPWSIDNGVSVKGENGMDLRDYFAAKAIPSVIDMLTDEFNMLESGHWTWHNQDFLTVAERAYKIADAMMKVREK
jgi:hypothetical protein